MKRWFSKLRSRSGETLTETLAAVLVVSCASVLLATMILAASRLNTSARTQDAALYRALSAAEAQATPDGSAEIIASDARGNTYRFDVSVYGEADGLRSYRKEAAP